MQEQEQKEEKQDPIPQETFVTYETDIPLLEPALKMYYSSCKQQQMSAVYLNAPIVVEAWENHLVKVETLARNVGVKDLKEIK